MKSLLSNTQSNCFEVQLSSLRHKSDGTLSRVCSLHGVILCRGRGNQMISCYKAVNKQPYYAMAGLADLFILLNITKRLGRQTREDDDPQTSSTCPRMWTLIVGYTCHLRPGFKRRPAIHWASRRQLSRSQSLSSSAVCRGGLQCFSSVIATLVNGQFYTKVILWVSFLQEPKTKM